MYIYYLSVMIKREIKYILFDILKERAWKNRIKVWEKEKNYERI